MKKSFLALVIISAALFVSCEKKTETVVNEDGGTSTVEKVGFDEEKIDSTATNIKEGAKEAAAKTGEALEDAGAAIKEGAEKTGDKIEKATDGDGDANK